MTANEHDQTPTPTGPSHQRLLDFILTRPWIPLVVGFALVLGVGIVTTRTVASTEQLNEDVRDALDRLDPMWGELFPAEQARIVRTLVERVVVGPDGADIRLRVEGMAGLVRDLGVNGAGALQEAG